MNRWKLVVVGLSLAGCGGGGLEDREDVAQMAGDALATFEETGQGGAFAWQMRVPGRLGPSLGDRLWNLALPEAHAAGCWTALFSQCAASKRTRTFDSCTVGPATYEGSVTLTFSDTGCAMSTVGNSVTRTADFKITTKRGSFAVSSPTGGQKVTRTAAGFGYSVLGMRRVVSNAQGTVLADVSTKTTADIAVTGLTRADRTMNGGTLEITHNLRNYTVALSPDSLKWSATCTCPVSGKLNGTVTGAPGTTTFSLEMTGCGTATLSTGRGGTETVTFDRCAAI